MTPDHCDDLPETTAIKKNGADPNNGNNSDKIQEQITPKNQSPCNLSQGNMLLPIKCSNMDMPQSNMVSQTNQGSGLEDV